MKKIFTYFTFCFALLFLFLKGNAQTAGLKTTGNMMTSTSINISSGTSLIIPGNINISGPTDYILNNGNCYIAGNFTNAGVSFSALGNGTEVFNGNTTIGGTKNSIFNNFIINGGATVATVKGIDIKNDWTNNGRFIPNTSQVSFSGTVASQNIYGTGTFFDLVIQNNTNFLVSKDTIKDQFSNTASITGGTSRIVFDSAAKIISSYSKFFYDMEILSGANVNHTTGGGDIHIDNSYTNNGTYTEGASYTTYFDKVAATVNLSGTGTTTFGNITIGKAGTIGLGTTLNANAHSFTVGGTTFTFNHSNSVFNGGTGTVTFNGSADLIGKAMSVTGVTASFYGVTVLNATTLGIDATVNGPLSITNLANALSINGNTLTLNGTVTGSGTLTGSASSNLSVGSSGNLGTLNFNQATNNTTNVLKNFTVNFGAFVSVGNPLNITPGTASSTYGIVAVNGALNANGMLTLKSNQYGDAVIGQSNGSILNGTVVERYIPARRAWRFLSVPFIPGSVGSSQSINTAWQEGQVNTQLPCTFNQVGPAGAGFGTQITYDNNPSHGFDVNTTTNPSIKTWINNAWTTPNSTYSALITDYPAYCLFVRGDRYICLDQAIYAPPNNTVLRIKGSLNQNGNPVSNTYSSAAAGDFIFVGNPYASPINITNVIDGSRTTGYNTKQFWVWDPHVGGTYGVGDFVTFSNGMQVPNGSGRSDATYTGGLTIQSGQAFFLQLNNSSTSAAVQFKEADKVLFQTNVFNKQTNKKLPAIYTNLILPSDDSSVLVDGVGAAFGKTYAASVDEMDAQKMANFDENMMLVRDDKNLAIEFRPIPAISDTLFYKLYLRQQPYMLQIFSADLPLNLPVKAWLVDKYLHAETPVNLYDTTLYKFAPNADTNSYRNRFMLVFKRTLKTTPVSLNKALNSNVIVSSGGEDNSSINKKTHIVIYPNPVIKGNKTALVFGDLVKGKYEVTINNADGEKLITKTINHPGGVHNYYLQTDSKWATGTYLVTINGEGKYRSTTKLIIVK